MAAIEEKEVEKNISEDLVVTKYKLAGEIVNSKYINGFDYYFGHWKLFSTLFRFQNIPTHLQFEIPSVAWHAVDSFNEFEISIPISVGFILPEKQMDFIRNYIWLELRIIS